MLLRHTPFDEPPTHPGMHEEVGVLPSSDYSAVELGELASSVSRLLMACLGAKQGGRLLALDANDHFLLDNAKQLVEDGLTALHFLVAKDRLAPGTDKITLCNCMVQTVLNKQMGTGRELSTIQDLQSYFEGIASVLAKARESGIETVTERQLAIAQLFFLELANRLPFEQRDDETKVTITMEEVLLRELKRVAQEEGVPVHKLVADIILGHLNGSKATAAAGSRL